MKRTSISTIFLILGFCLQAQLPYTISPTAGLIQNANFSLESSSGNIVSGQLAGVNLQVIHIIHAIEEDPGTGLSNLPNNGSITVYPNPFQSSIYLDLHSIQISHVAIFDSLGKMVYFDVFTSTELNLSELTTGVYLLKLLNESFLNVASFKILKL